MKEHIRDKIYQTILMVVILIIAVAAIHIIT